MKCLPKVSIVTVFYNREDLVSESMKSLVEQDYDNFEVIAIDDGSTDGTLSELQKFSSFKNVKVISLENNGFVKAIKHAITISSGEFVAVHGSGDLSHSNRIRLQAKELVDKSNVGLVASRSKFIVVDSNIEYIKGEPVVRSYEKSLLAKNFFHHGEVMYRRSLYEKVGGYREFFKFAQDMDLWCRMSHHCKFSLLESVLYTRYINQPDSVSENPEKTKLQRKLAKFATHCHKCRIFNGYDPLDKYGYYSLLDFSPSAMGQVYFKQAIRQIISGKKENAKMFIGWSKSEKYLLAFILDYAYAFLPKTLPFLLSKVFIK